MGHCFSRYSIYENSTPCPEFYRAHLLNWADSSSQYMSVNPGCIYFPTALILIKLPNESKYKYVWKGDLDLTNGDLGEIRRILLQNYPIDTELLILPKYAHDNKSINKWRLDLWICRLKNYHVELNANC